MTNCELNDNRLVERDRLLVRSDSYFVVTLFRVSLFSDNLEYKTLYFMFDTL